MGKKKQKSQSMKKQVTAAAVLASEIVKGKRKSKKKSSGKGTVSFHANGMGIPVALGARNPAHKVSFYTAKKRRGHESGLGARISLPLVGVAVEASSASGAGAILDVAATSPYPKLETLDPSIATRWINPALPLLTGIFDQFGINQVEFEYCPNGASTTAVAPFIFGFVEDPMHPSLTSVTPAKVLGFEHQIEFNAYQPWKMKIPLSGDLKYSYDTGTTSGEARWQDPGTFVLMQEFASSGAVSYGKLWAHIDIELYGFSPIYKTVSLNILHPDDVLPPRVVESKTDDSDREDYLVLKPGSVPRPLNGLVPPVTRRI